MLESYLEMTDYAPAPPIRGIYLNETSVAFCPEIVNLEKQIDTELDALFADVILPSSLL